MKPQSLAQALALLLISSAPAIAEEAIDIAARRESVADLETHITQREARLAEWAKDVQDLDARIEKRVDELVKLVAGLRDSQDSRRRITKLKMDTIDGLQRGIDLYIAKRKEIRERVRTGGDEGLGDLGKIDARIIKHIDQIAELTKSIPSHQDVEKYESDGGAYWNGYYYENNRLSEEWKQNRRDAGGADKQRNETAKALEEALERLEDRRRLLTAQLADGGKLSESTRALYTTELGQADAYHDHISAQLREVTTGGGGGGQPVGMEQAQDIENMVEDARKDLREDVARLFRSYDQFVRGRAYLEGLRKNLAARKEWLEKNAD